MFKRIAFVAIVLVLLAGMLPTAIAQDDALVIWADDTRAPILEGVGEQFTEEFGIDVVVEVKGFGDIRDQLRIAGPAGEGPDIIIGAHDWLGELVVNGLLAPIDLGDLQDQFLPAAVQAFEYDGELYGMPYATENVALIYNPDIVPEPPTTWDEVHDLAVELEDAGTVEYAYLIQTNDGYHFFPILSAFGGYVFGLTDTGYDPNDVGLDSPGAIAAAEWLQMMVDEGHIPADIGYGEMHEFFGNGDTAMIITGPWALANELRTYDVPYAITNLPSETEEGRPFLGVQGFMVSAFSENQILAETFLTGYVATEEVMQAIYDADPRPSAFLPVREATEDPDLAAFAAAGTNGMAMPAIPEMNNVWSAYGGAMELVIRGTQSGEEAFTNAAAQIREAIAAPEFVARALVGSLQDEIGCDADWLPDCEASFLTEDADTGLWSATFSLPAGEYEFKVAFDGDWGENYGADGERDGDNIPLVLEADSDVTFTFDPESHIISAEVME